MLCEREWYEKHKNDHTEAEIAALGIEIIVDGKKTSHVTSNARKGTVKAITQNKVQNISQEMKEVEWKSQS